MPKKSLIVLLVEDDPDDSALIGELLADIDTYSVALHRAANYAEARAAMKERQSDVWLTHHQFDICLTDHRLGEKTGLDLIRDSQADGFTAPMILLSGSEEYELDVKAMEAGAADFMVKAKMSVPSLERSIRHAIDRSQSLEDHRIQSDLIGAIIGEGIYSLDIQGRVTFLNHASERILGWTEADLLGNDVHDVIHFEDADGKPMARENCPLLKVLVKGNTYHLADGSFIHRDGRRIAVSCTSAPIIKNGSIVGAVFNFHDITEQKRAENERRVVTETLLAISATAGIEEMLDSVRHALSKVVYADKFYVVLYDAAGSLNQVSATVAGREKEGPDPSEVLGSALIDYVGSRSRPTLLTADVIRRLVSEKELQILGTVPAVWVGVPLRSAAGPLGIMVLQHYEDEIAFNERDLDLLAAVGAYVAQSIDRKRIEKALSEAAKRESSMIENALDVICTIDGEGRFITINPACFRMWGYQPEELIGQRFINYVAPVHQSRTASKDMEIRTGTETTNFENQYVHKDGSIVDVRWTSYWSEVDQLVFAVAHDITERRRMEIELERTRDAALESARLKSEFLANMSHEIRTPMNGVVGMTELLLKTALTDQQRQFTKTIEASADSLLHIIDEILDFSKIEAGQMRFETIDFDLREAVEVPVEMFAGRAQAKGVEIASLVHSDVPLGLRGDPGRLQQILTNLIGNAVKFTEDGDVFVNATLQSETSTHAVVRFEIKDTGIGISEASQQKLFHAFVQADGTTTRRYGGTGLGLAISKQLVELMGGGIELKSKLGEGSVFSFTVRFEKQKARSHASLQGPGVGLTGLRVLVVDDKETNRQILLHQTASWGMFPSDAGSAADALKILRASPGAFDVVMLDLMMPEMDGFDLAREIKASPELSHLKLVLLSSFGKSGQSETARQIGIDEFLQKPIRQSQIYNCLLKVVNNSEAPTLPQRGQIAPLLITPAVGDGNTVALHSNIRILVADDNEINLEVGRNQLHSLGYAAEFVQNGQEAVDAAKRTRFDVILMDCQMPEKDGFEATAEIRVFDGKDRHTTIVAVTAHALAGDREKCLAAGMDDYLGKPVKIDALKAVLERWTQPETTDEAEEWPEELSPGPDNVGFDPTVLASYEELQQPGEPDFIVKLIGMFMDRSCKSISHLKQAAVAGDMDEVARQAHGIKGTAGNIGASSMVTLSARLETADSPTHAAQLAAQLETVFQETSKILVSMRDQRQKGEIRS